MSFPINKNMYRDLSVPDVKLVKSVRFDLRSYAIASNGLLYTTATKEWDGSSPDSILYSALFYEFLTAPISVTLSERNNKIFQVLYPRGESVIMYFIQTALSTQYKLENPKTKSVCIWDKGGGSKNGSFSISTKDPNSLAWVKIFVKALKKSNGL
jgi:hypothetical protein